MFLGSGYSLLKSLVAGSCRVRASYTELHVLCALHRRDVIQKSPSHAPIVSASLRLLLPGDQTTETLRGTVGVCHPPHLSNLRDNLLRSTTHIIYLLHNRFLGIDESIDAVLQARAFGSIDCRAGNFGRHTFSPAHVS